MKSWKQKPPQKFLAFLASKTVGFCGSDLQALCTEAVMCCVRRNYPQIYTSKSKYHINERSLKVNILFVDPSLAEENWSIFGQLSGNSRAILANFRQLGQLWSG